MFAGEERPGLAGSPRSHSGSSAEDDDDGDDVSHHTSEGRDEEDDEDFDDDSADHVNPRKATRPKVPWGPDILRHGWTNVEKTAAITLPSAVGIGPWSSEEATPPILLPSTAWSAASATVCAAPGSCASWFPLTRTRRLRVICVRIPTSTLLAGPLIGPYTASKPCGTGRRRRDCYCMQITLASFKSLARTRTTWGTKATGPTACGWLIVRRCLTPCTAKHSRSRTGSKPWALTPLTRSS